MKVGRRKLNFDSPSLNKNIIENKHDIHLEMPGSVKGQNYHRSFERSQFQEKDARIK